MLKRAGYIMGLVAAATLAGDLSEARTTPGSNATSTSHSFIGCLDINAAFNSGVATNVCSRAQFVLPLPVDNAGGKTVTMTIISSAQSGVICQAVGVGKTGTGGAASAFVAAPGGSSATQDLNLSGVNVPGGGFLFVDCSVDTGDSLVVANYGA